MKVGSMFAGIGGFDLGFERAGFEVAWCIEIDKSAQEVLRRNFPNAKVYGDITEVDPDTLEKVDVICGGFPCQDLSVAGRRKGLAGERSGLFHEAMRIVRRLNPRVLVLENVTGLLSSNNGLDFATVIREVGEGWSCQEVAWRVLDSQFFGVAQRRRRVFVVASSDIGCAEQILALSEECGGNPPSRDEPRQEAGSASPVRSGADGEFGTEGRFIPVTYQDIVGNLNACDAKQVQNQMVSENKFICMKEAIPIQDGREMQKSQNGFGIGEIGDPSYTIDTTGAQAVAVQQAIPIAYRKSRRAQTSDDDETLVDDGLANTLNGFDLGDVRTTHAVIGCDVYNGVETMEVSATVTSAVGIGNASGPKAIDRMVVRRLTPEECCRLQGFPDDWNSWLSDSQRYRQLGNAVTVNVAEWIARRTMKALSEGERHAGDVEEDKP